MQKLSSWKYDPANFFRVNYNIKPALTRAGLDQKTQTLDRPVNCRARDRRRNRDHDAVARPRADAQAIYERQRHADLAVDADARARILAVRYQPEPDSAGPSWLTVLGHTKDSLWSLDLFRCESAVRAHTGCSS